MWNAGRTKTMTKNLVDTLGREPRFAKCNGRDLEALAVAGTMSTVPSGWPLIHELTPSDCCYVLLAGEVEVRVDRDPVARLEAGSVFGEVGLFTGNLRNATVVSTTPVTVLHVNAPDFHRLVAGYPAMRMALRGPAMENIAS
jgi:CRP-like cAMP-binding protein